MIAAIDAKVDRLYTLLCHCVHPTLDICRARSVVDYNSGLTVEARLEGIDGRRVFVELERIFILHHGVAVIKQFRRCRRTRVEDDWRDCRRDLGVCIPGCFLVVGVYGAGSGVVDFIEENATDGDVGLGVRGPFGVDVDLGRQG